MNSFKNKFIKFLLFVVFVSAISAGLYYWTNNRGVVVKEEKYKTLAENDVYVRFGMEAYDSIMKNYWKKATESDLASLFQLSVQKAENSLTLPSIASSDRAGTANLLSLSLEKASSTDAKKKLILNILMVALYNLVPQGRNGMLSSVQEKELRQNVANINPANDLYKSLGVAEGTSKEEVDKAYKEKEAELSKQDTPEAKEKLTQISYAHKVLTDTSAKIIYDQTKVEPTVFKHILGSTLYLYLEKISPTTIGEFVRAVDSASTSPKLSSMIIDLRSNVGGDLSFPQYFLGLFLGQNQYAFDLFHQDIYDAQRTVTPQFPELDRYKEMAIITNGQTQSTAELLTATLKRLRLAHVVGTKTRGWGSVENTYPIATVIDPNEKYSLLLVNSLTLRDDNQPIEINGVLPDIDIGDTDWKKKLPNYFDSSSMIDGLRQVVDKSPMR